MTMEITMTEREVFEWKMGRKMTDDQILQSASKRGDLSFILTSTKVYKLCEICERPFCINNWDDKKKRTPRMFKFIICPDCDPRHPDDRYMKEGWRILQKHKLRIVRYAQVTRAMSLKPCLYIDYRPNCKCAACVAGKLMPPF
jgi:hypothetical protein